ncbi:hypothetical protein ACFL60_05335 [Candidatus Omnitrophota bacterium]
MKELSEHLKKISDAFLTDIKDAFGKSLKSVVLYGPAARGEIYKDHPYINLLVIVGDNTPSELARCAKQVKKWHKRLITTPLFLDPSYIESSLDTFPLEFMDMNSAYNVLYGDDVLNGLVFNVDDVRSQCERELKGKLIHLRTEYLAIRGNKKLLIDLINRSLNTFRLVFAGALFLKGCEIPENTQSLIDKVIGEYGLGATVFQRLFSIVKGSVKISETEADELFDLYVEELDSLSGKIDSMTNDQVVEVDENSEETSG